jgi:hypothetical protein
MFEHIQMVTGLYGSAREQHANTHTIQSTYLSFKKREIESVSQKGEILFVKFHFN